MHQRLTARMPLVKGPDEDPLEMSFDFSNWLAADVLITAVDSIAASPSGLTFDNEIPNAAAFNNDDGREVAIGKGVTFDVSGGTSGVNYQVTCIVTITGGFKRQGVGTLMVRDR